MRFLIPVMAATACAATTPGANPHDMSMAGHEAAATHEQQTAELHAAQFKPEAAVSREHCPALTTRQAPEAAGSCWTSVTNPTSEHLEMADRHRKMAADHRAASQALRDAEAKACIGIADADRDMSPFAHREDIASVAPLQVTTAGGRNQWTRMEGAVITFRAVPAMTAQWLQRIVDCHLARNAAMGHVSPEMPYCPLVPKDVTAKVAPTSDGFAVQIRSDDPATAQEILRRAQALTR